jgi:hypothetical protein
LWQPEKLSNEPRRPTQADQIPGHCQSTSPTRAIAGVMLGDLLSRMKRGVELSKELRERLGGLVVSPTAPYAGPELPPLGRPGWSWLDIDPLPVLSRAFPELCRNLSRAWNSTVGSSFSPSSLPRR